MNQVIPIFTFGIGLTLKNKCQFIIRVILPEIIINIKLSGQIDLITRHRTSGGIRRAIATRGPDAAAGGDPA